MGPLLHLGSAALCSPFIKGLHFQAEVPDLWELLFSFK
jgi:hypothetical protein